MVRCVNCANLRRQTRFCRVYKTTIKLKHVHVQLPCDKYESRWKPKISKEVIADGKSK